MTKQQLKEIAKRYEECFKKQLEALPKWKRLAVEEDIRDKKNSAILSDFVTSVITAAESEETIKPTKKSAVNKITPKQYQEEVIKRFL